MTRTTPPRPSDVEALFPELAAHRGTTTRLHPRPGAPEASESSVGGPLLWPADESWPMCRERHERGPGRRPEDIHAQRRISRAAWSRDPAGPTDEERRLLTELGAEQHVPTLRETDPLPMIGLAQLYRRDVPDLPAGPQDRDLLQVFWCPFDRHGPTGYGMSLELRWRKASEVTERLRCPPQPPLVGFPGYVPEPCVLHPERVVTHRFAGLLPSDLETAINAWEDAGHGCYQHELSIPPGWRVGGFASWHVTDPYPMDCLVCGASLTLLLTIDSCEWDGGSGSWRPLEEDGLPPHPFAKPTEVVVGRGGELNVFVCPEDAEHPPRWSLQ